MKKYVFINYNAEYQVFFFSEKNEIAKALGLTAKIEHIGSTAVPGLGGKGIVDIVVGVSQKRLPEAKIMLQEAGYDFRQQASCPERLFFRIDHPYNNRTRRVHVHLTEINGETWQRMIGFRDFLRTHPDAVHQYSEIKKEGIQIALGDGRKYREYKEGFIEDVLKKALEKFII